VCRSICFQVGSLFASKETNTKSVTAPPREEEEEEKKLAGVRALVVITVSSININTIINVIVVVIVHLKHSAS
jgi:hypothetical protein